MSEQHRDPKEKKCAQCGKDMYAGDDWAYRLQYRGRTLWFDKYSCKRKFEKENLKPEKPLVPQEDTEERPPKKQESRAVLAQKLAEEIKAGRNINEFLKAEGYRNPYDAYHAVRHFCETNMPEMLTILKPMRELKQKNAPKTGRPRKYKAEEPKANEEPPEEEPPGHSPADSKPQPDIEIIAVRTEMGEFAKHGDAINWIYGSGVEAMHAELTPEEWRDFAKDIVPAAMDVLEGGGGE